MSNFIFILIFLITIIIQIITRYIYLKYKGYGIRSNYSGEDVSRFILKNSGHNDVIVSELQISTNYEQFDFKEQVIHLKRSVYNGKSMTSVAIAAQRTYLYLVEERSIIGRIKTFLLPFIDITIKLSWFSIIIGFLTRYISLVYLGISILILVFIYNLIMTYWEMLASKLALNYLKKEIIEDEEIKDIQTILVANILFHITNYSQPIFDLIYYTLKHLKKDKMKSTR